MTNDLELRQRPLNNPQGIEEMTGKIENIFSGIKLKTRCQNTSDTVKALLELFLPYAGPSTALSLSLDPNPAGLEILGSHQLESKTIPYC